MRKNLAGQKLSFALVAKADGSAVTTGTTTAYVTIDGGTQTTGGTAVHEGQGQWTYAPSAGETNGDSIGFTFINSAAVPVNLQVFPIPFTANGEPLVALSYLGTPIIPAAEGTALDDVVVETGINGRQALAQILSFIAGERTGVPAPGVAGDVTFKDPTGTITRIVITVDIGGNITNVIHTPPA